MSPPDPLHNSRLQLYAARPDEALVQGLQRGDERAFREIYERYWYQLFQLASRKTGARETAEEIVQEVFTALWHKRETAHIEQLAAYLFTAVKYRIIDYYKAEQRRSDYLTVERGWLSELDHGTEDAVAADDLARALEAGVQTLPEQTRQVFYLSRTEHRSVAEIAEHLHLSPKTVEYHLTKALKQLRVSLKDFLPLLLLWLAGR